MTIRNKAKTDKCNLIEKVIFQGYGYIEGLGTLTDYDLMLEYFSMSAHPRETVKKITMEFEKGNLIYEKSHGKWFVRNESIGL